jgi:anti-sigma regulatory factor (Ser/Thr protein kinase)
MTQKEPTPRLALDFPATLAGFEHGFAQLRTGLDSETLEPLTRYRIELVFEEIVANIVRHGAPKGGAKDVRVTFDVQGDSILLTFDDDGSPYDPRTRGDPPPVKSLEEVGIGGRGLLMVRRASSAIDYCRTADQRNRLTVTLPASTPNSNSIPSTRRKEIK